MTRDISIFTRLSADTLERLLLTTLQNATAAAALHAAHARGRDNRHFADQLAVTAMRDILNEELMIPAEVLIGEGERDKAPMLYIGEKLGTCFLEDSSEQLLYLAVDPLEGTNLCARGEAGSLSVVAAALKGQGGLSGGIDGYMEKLVIGRDLYERYQVMRVGAGTVYDHNYWYSLLDVPLPELMKWIATERRKPISDIVAMVLERPRNQHIIDTLRSLHVQIKLIRDGDVTAGLLALDPHHDVDIALGIGAAAEGVITAAMARVYGGYMEARWWLPDDERMQDHKLRLIKAGARLGQVLKTEDLAQGHVMFSVTAVTGNDFMQGVRYGRGATLVQTVAGRSRTGTINIRNSIHQNPPPAPKKWPQGTDGG